jgi:hypothetical protein
MHETSEDLAELQRRLDDSYAAAGEHIRSIFVPALRSSAEDLARALTGVFIINLATVTAKCEPLVAPVDGLFYRGRLWFGLPPRSQRARHVRARPAVSATQMEGDLSATGGRCLIVHGIAHEVTYGHPLHAGYSRYVLPLYGLPVPDDLDNDPNEGRPREDFTGFVEPRRIFAQGFG